jgi:allophanate hydrolase
MGPAFFDKDLQILARRLEAMAAFDPPPLDLNIRPAETVKLAVVGAHLAGMPLHWQLATRNARLVGQTRTAAAYKLYAMAHCSPPKPALVHVGTAGSAIEIEVYELPLATFGSFVAEVAAPLAIGAVTLADGSEVKGFVAEPRALEGAQDITIHGGWRAYLTALD